MATLLRRINSYIVLLGAQVKFSIAFGCSVYELYSIISCQVLNFKFYLKDSNAWLKRKSRPVGVLTCSSLVSTQSNLKYKMCTVIYQNYFSDFSAVSRPVHYLPKFSATAVGTFFEQQRFACCA